MKVTLQDAELMVQAIMDEERTAHSAKAATVLKQRYQIVPPAHKRKIV